MSTYITQVVSLGPCIAPCISLYNIGFKVFMSTYITKVVSLGPCIAPFIRFVQYWFQILYVHLYHPSSLTGTLHCPLYKICTILFLKSLCPPISPKQSLYLPISPKQSHWDPELRLIHYFTLGLRVTLHRVERDSTLFGQNCRGLSGSGQANQVQ